MSSENDLNANSMNDYELIRKQIKQDKRSADWLDEMESTDKQTEIQSLINLNDDQLSKEVFIAIFLTNSIHVQRFIHYYTSFFLTAWY